MNIELVIYFALASGYAADDQHWRSLFQQSREFKEKGDYRQARATIQETVVEASTFGVTDLRLAISLNEAGAMEQLFGNPRESERLLLRAIRMLEQQPNETSHLANSLANLSLVYMMFDKRYGEAEKLLRRALELLVRDKNASQQDVMNTMANLAASRVKQGDLREAKALYEKVLLSEPRTEPSRALNLSNLGLICVELNDMEGALSNFTEAISSIDLLSGPEHPTLIAPLYNLGSTYLKLGRPTLSEAATRRALKIAENRLGASEPILPQILARMVELRRAAGDKKQAREFEARAKALETDPIRTAVKNSLVHVSELAGKSGTPRNKTLK